MVELASDKWLMGAEMTQDQINRTIEALYAASSRGWNPTRSRSTGSVRARRFLDRQTPHGSNIVRVGD